MAASVLRIAQFASLAAGCTADAAGPVRAATAGGTGRETRAGDWAGVWVRDWAGGWAGGWADGWTYSSRALLEATTTRCVLGRGSRVTDAAEAVGEATQGGVEGAVAAGGVVGVRCEGEWAPREEAASAAAPEGEADAGCGEARLLSPSWSDRFGALRVALPMELAEPPARAAGAVSLACDWAGERWVVWAGADTCGARSGAAAAEWADAEATDSAMDSENDEPREEPGGSSAMGPAMGLPMWLLWERRRPGDERCSAETERGCEERGGQDWAACAFAVRSPGCCDCGCGGGGWEGSSSSSSLSKRSKDFTSPMASDLTEEQNVARGATWREAREPPMGAGAGSLEGRPTSPRVSSLPASATVRHVLEEAAQEGEDSAAGADSSFPGAVPSGRGSGSDAGASATRVPSGPVTYRVTLRTRPPPPAGATDAADAADAAATEAADAAVHTPGRVQGLAMADASGAVAGLIELVATGGAATGHVSSRSSSPKLAEASSVTLRAVSEGLRSPAVGLGADTDVDDGFVAEEGFGAGTVAGFTATAGCEVMDLAAAGAARVLAVVFFFGLVAVSRSISSSKSDEISRDSSRSKESTESMEEGDASADCSRLAESRLEESFFLGGAMETLDY